MSRGPSLAAVARAAGVALGTVSNVLNRPDRVREQTRARVYSAMREVGYSPARVIYPTELGTDDPPATSGSGDMALPLLVSAGYISVDYIAQVGVMPHRDDRITAECIHKELGGPAANVAVAAAALGRPFGLRVELATAVGQDMDSRWALEKLAERGVRACALRDPLRDRLSRCIVLVEADGRRTKINEPLQLHEDDLFAHLLSEPRHGRRHLHVEGYQIDHARALLPAVREAGWTVSIHDTGLPDACRDAAGLERLVADFDLVFLNRRTTEAMLGHRGGTEALTAALVARSWAAARHGDLIVTLGAEGAVAFSEDGGVTRVSPPEVDVVDGTGAGDCLVGVYLAHWLHGICADEALGPAVTAASLSTTRRGAQGLRLGLAEIRAAGRRATA